jgi:hypothetical protein
VVHQTVVNLKAGAVTPATSVQFEGYLGRGFSPLIPTDPIFGHRFISSTNFSAN